MVAVIKQDNLVEKHLHNISSRLFVPVLSIKCASLALRIESREDLIIANAISCVRVSVTMIKITIRIRIRKFQLVDLFCTIMLSQIPIRSRSAIPLQYYAHHWNVT